MNKRGVKLKETISTEWSQNFAYAIGLLASDGSLSKDGRHVDFTSKDIEQVKNFVKCLGCKNKIGKKISGSAMTESYRIQIGSVIFYNFLISIGLTPAKSKTIGEVMVPEEYFFDFVRGLFDGDGTFYSYWDSRWKSSHMFYLVLTSASKKHLLWLKETIKCMIGSDGHITQNKSSSVFQLKYGKLASLEIIKKMYYSTKVVSLSRKRLKIKKVLGVEAKQQSLYKKI